ncbi:MAG TPA: hypothetical protein VGK48_26965 [Terriglobia bacterium]|jgi:hypothetical protein
MQNTDESRRAAAEQWLSNRALSKLAGTDQELAQIEVFRSFNLALRFAVKIRTGNKRNAANFFEDGTYTAADFDLAVKLFTIARDSRGRQQDDLRKTFGRLHAETGLDAIEQLGPWGDFMFEQPDRILNPEDMRRAYEALRLEKQRHRENGRKGGKNGKDRDPRLVNCIVSLRKLYPDMSYKDLAVQAELEGFGVSGKTVERILKNP